MSRLLRFAAIAYACAFVTSIYAAEQDVNLESPVAALGFRAIPQFFSGGPGQRRGEASGVALNSKGHIYLFQRAEPMLAEYDPNGSFVRSLGEGLFVHPHGLRIDANDDIWTTDDESHLVLKLSPAGEVLLVLGRRNTAAEAEWLFNQPTDIAFGKNGEIYVADGYGNSRIVKFDHEGNFLKSWGRYGGEPGEFNLPHSVVVDDKGRVYVGDRENQRIQIFDSDGTYLTQWTSIGYPYGLFITLDQHVWMIDGGYDRVVEFSPDGRMLGTFGEPGHSAGQFAWGHFLAIGADKKLYVADVLNWRFQVFESVPPSGRNSTYVPARRMFWDRERSTGWSTGTLGRAIQFSTPWAISAVVIALLVWIVLRRARRRKQERMAA
jgi:DNA-binding beta-propeller fold protein YncE